MFSFSAEINDDYIRKSALIQSKMFKQDGEFIAFPSKTAERKELLAQCKRMEKIAPNDSFIFIYSRDGIIFFPTAVITNKITGGVIGVNFIDGLSLENFVGSLFECSIGDHDLPIMNSEQFFHRLKELEITDGFMVEVKDI